MCADTGNICEDLPVVACTTHSSVLTDAFLMMEVIADVTHRERLLLMCRAGVVCVGSVSPPHTVADGVQLLLR